MMDNNLEQTIITNHLLSDRVKYIAYIRKSKKDHSSSLGLDAQKAEIERFVESHGGVLIKTFIEIESGTSGKLIKRVKIWEAIEECKLNGAILIVAKLDRLARDVEFTSKLMNTGVQFVACDIPMANAFTIHVMAAVAEQEAKRISERTKAALEERRKKGLPMGANAHKNPKSSFGPEARERSREALFNKKINNENSRRGMAYAYKLYEGGMPLRDIAEMMNEEGFKSPTNKRIHNGTVARWIKNYFLLRATSPL